MTTVWITKYAVTKGIFTVDGEVHEGSSVSWKTNGWRQFAHGNDWHLSLRDAIEDAEKRRVSKIASLQKQIKKLEALRFGEGVA